MHSYYAKVPGTGHFVRQDQPLPSNAEIYLKGLPTGKTAAAMGLTPPPDVVTPQPISLRSRRFLDDEVAVESPPAVESPAPVPEAEITPAPDEGPKCCSKPMVIDGFCLNCGDGLKGPDHANGQ